MNCLICMLLIDKNRFFHKHLTQSHTTLLIPSIWSNPMDSSNYLDLVKEFKTYTTKSRLPPSCAIRILDHNIFLSFGASTSNYHGTMLRLLRCDLWREVIYLKSRCVCMKFMIVAFKCPEETSIFLQNSFETTGCPVILWNSERTNNSFTRSKVILFVFIIVVS